jgi:predicted PurR-regulated permease PerM
LQPVDTMSSETSHTTPEPEEAPRRAIELPIATIGKFLLILFALWILFKLWSLVTLVLVAIVLAIAFEPPVAWLERRRVPRWLASTFVVLFVVGLLIGFLVVCGSSLAAQGRQVLDRVGAVWGETARRLPPSIARVTRGGCASIPDTSALGGFAVAIGGAVAIALIVVAIAFILTIYLLTDGRRTWKWVIAYVPRRDRGRVEVTAYAARVAVLRYVVGNVATSVFAAVVVLIALSALHVPAALLLALLAGLCDFVPVLGFVVSALPAVLLALTVSAGTAVAVAAVYLAYHMAENYYIGPKVYGGQLRLSNMAVLLAFAVGAELGGVVGALLALPIAAMYPVIEDVWLRDYLGRDAVDAHRRIEHEHHN